MSDESYDYTIVISAAILAVIFLRLTYWSKYQSLLIPYYQPHDISQIGYIRFSELTKERPIYRIIFYHKLLLPIWAIIYLFILLLLDFIMPTSVEVSSDYFYFFVFALGFCLFDWLNMSRTIFRFCFLFIIPYLLGQYLLESTFGGYLAVAFVLSISVAFFLKDSVEFLFFKSEVEKQTKKSLTGKDLTKFTIDHSFKFVLKKLNVNIEIYDKCVTIPALFNTILECYAHPLFMLYTIIKMVAVVFL
ncbi:MAG: hypothetical protein IPM81_01990 [Saprospirales bacterium]|nr:hypothetical protein [Saprospirales bacterium]